MNGSKPCGAPAIVSTWTKEVLLNILITGGAGFIGSHLTDALLREGHRVTVIDNLSSGSRRFLSDDAEFIEADIRDRDALRCFSDHHFDIVYHEAAQTMVPASISDPYHDADENIMGLLSVLEAARAHGVRKIIFSSSAAVYGDNTALPLKEDKTPRPLSFYGLTKWITEKYLALYSSLYGLDYTILRYSNVYGPRQGAKGEGGVIYIFSRLLAEGKPLTIFGTGKQTRDFINVHDVVSANLAALTRGSGAVCNVSTGTEVSLTALAEKMIALSEKNVPIQYGPARAGDIFRSCLSPSLAQECLGWTPAVSLDDGLKETISFFNEQHA